ncbi:glutathione-dependent disulfide-bond oxidoreductase [Acinetobacter sp. B10A]|uniref:glutathione-dependent disulfide-bond oxidoreductase n=1 Tax=Acinetobacter baretiae TaxID=2605383 RepID=UPI001B3C503E|nr:glutathione-dependent disulfide-bond oxidoreductase [Acinetobacter baretiae]MBF7686384.1 glutathione-dependent disulfide-bond oxidoreductase [Acinetobacter baretiae]
MLKEYTPPLVWDEKTQGMNSPTSGCRYDKELSQGEHPFQLYSLATPNGQKVTIMFEELLELGIKDAEYDAFLINIGKGEQFSSGFVKINPNSKIPALVDRSNPSEIINIFESGNILLYLAEKFKKFIPIDLAKRTIMMNWLFWLQGSAPYIGGGFGHFYVYAPQKIEYAIDRFTLETKRQLDLLDKHLSENEFIAGDSYTIADIAIWPWFGNLVLGNIYNAVNFLNTDHYKNLKRWALMLQDRPAIKRGTIVNRLIGNEWEVLPERHSGEDIDTVLLKKP